MARTIRNCTKVLALLSSLAFVAVVGSGQTLEADSQRKKAIKFDEFGDVGRCDRRARLARYWTELHDNQDHQGYIISYSSIASAGVEDLARREREIAQSITFYHLRITLVRGGVRAEQATELWLVPPGADYPKPSGTISAQDIAQSPPPRQKSTYLFELTSIKYYSGDLEEFVLNSVKQRQREEQAEYEKANAKVIAAGKSDEPESKVDSAETEKVVMAALGMESREAVRFRWADVGIARLLAKTKGATGLIIFYADDVRYDIKKLQKFVEQGRDLLAEHGPLPKIRLGVKFGGYRESPETEFWFVPPNGPAPIASPEERCEETSE